MNLSLVRLTLRFKHSVASYPIQSDTLFGHVCWAVRDLEGQAGLDRFLGAPALVLSNGFPGGFVPRPKLPPLSRKQMQARGWITRENATRLKQIKKIAYLPRPTWEKLAQEGVSEEKIIDALWDSDPAHLKLPRPQVQAHNSIDRLSNRPLDDGGFFHSRTHVFAAGHNSVDVYACLSAEMPAARLHVLLQYIGLLGYGRDQSTGQGAFTVDDWQGWETVVLPAHGERIMSLSQGIPDADLTDGCYDLSPKYGRLGGYRANSGQPFKRPLLLHSAGSTYRPRQACKSYYGRLLDNLHATQAINHAAYILSWPYRVAEAAA